MQKAHNSWNHLTKKKKVVAVKLLNFKTYSEATIIKFSTGIRMDI